MREREGGKEGRARGEEQEGKSKRGQTDRCAFTADNPPHRFQITHFNHNNIFANKRH